MGLRADPHDPARSRIIPSSITSVLWLVLATLPARGAGAAEPIEVVVEAPMSSAPPRDPVAAGSVVRRERLEAAGVSAGDVLRTQPGVAVFDTGGYGAPSTAVIRGATSAQTPVYLAGVRLNDDVGGTADLSLVPLWFIDRAEVYRSGAPLDADELGIGGAIFFEPRLPKATEAGAGSMLGSYGAHALWGYGGAGDARKGALIGVRADGATNDYPFVDDGGTRFDPSDDRVRTRTNADARTIDIWGIGRTALGDRGRLQLVVNDVEREQGLPGLTLFPSREARSRVARRLGSVSSRVACASDDACVMTASTALLATSTEYRDPLREIALGSTNLSIDAARADQALRVQWRPSEHWTLEPDARVAAEHSLFAAPGVPNLAARRTFGRAALGVGYDLRAPELSAAIRGIGAVECHRTRASGKTPWSFPESFHAASDSGLCNELEPSARVGVESGTALLKVVFNAGRYARVPTLTELYGISGAVRGNGDLESEHGISLDAGLRAHAGSAKTRGEAYMDAFGFVRFASRLIAYERSSLGYVRPYNVGSARVAGAELLAGWRPLAVALLELSATLLDGRNTSSRRPVNDVLPYQPHLTLGPRIELGSRLDWGAIDAVKLTTAYFYQSSRYADAAGLVVIPEQGSLDLELELTTLRDMVCVRGRIANVLDQTRTDLIGYPLPGRAAYIAVEAKWSG